MLLKSCNHGAWLAAAFAQIMCPEVQAIPTYSNAEALSRRSVPSYKTLNYTDVALNTESVRWYIISSKIANQTDKEFDYQFETVHANDTLQTALDFEGQPLKQYWQGVHFRNDLQNDALENWNDSAAPFTSWTPQPERYQPVSLARHIWSSLSAVNASNHNQEYLDTTGQHAFALPKNIAFLTPLARLTWNDASFSFEDNPVPNNASKVHVGLFLGDSSAGASHQTIYETMELRRAYVENTLRARPHLTTGLLNFVQCGKSPLVGAQPLNVLSPIIEGTLFADANSWETVAAEDYFFTNAASAVEFFKNLSELSDLLWEGSSGSFTFATQIHLVFSWIDEL